MAYVAPTTGREPLPAIAVHTHPEGLLAAIMPLGLAHSLPTALVIDLDPYGVRLPGERTLRDLVTSSPSADDLRPRRRGVACLPNGGVTFDEAAPIVEALMQGWPATVLRVDTEVAPLGTIGVGVRPILPGVTIPHHFLPVFQPTGLSPIPGRLPGIVLPRLPSRVAKALLGGISSGGHWTRSCATIWDLASGTRP